MGIVTSQRTWGDTDFINPQMVSRSGLRWYKNRVLYNYDMDAKNPFKTYPKNRDGHRALFTMAYTAASRLLLGVSFSKMTDEQLFDLSRTYPYHTAAKSARPADAFVKGVEFPQIYDFEVNPQWHQVVFYNTVHDPDEWHMWKGYRYFPLGEPVASTITADLSGEVGFGGLGLKQDAEYYIYDFWNDSFVGKYSGSQQLQQQLRPGEARVMSIRQVLGRPQVLSTSRHIMQGYLDMSDVKWNEAKKQLFATSKVIAGEPYKIVLAANGYELKELKADKAEIKADKAPNKNDLLILTIKSEDSRDIDWKAIFSK